MDLNSPRDYIPPFRGGHRLITWAAMQCLPEWQRELWKDQIYALSDVYSLYGDTYHGKPEELGPFVLLPDGSEPPFEMTRLRYKHHIAHGVDFWESPFYEPVEKAEVYFLRRITDCMARGDMLAAAQFAGTMAHHWQDSGVPAHAPDHSDLEIVRDYLPFPEAFAAFPLHPYTEQSPAPFLINDYHPRLYGQTVEEAGGNLIDRYVELVLFARSLLFPLAECAYTGDHTRAGQLRSEAAKMCAYTYADFMYTATCIGMGRFEPREIAALQVLRLTNRWPFRQTAWSPAPYFEPAPLRLRGINLDMKRNPVPCEVLIGEDGAVRGQRYPESLGAGAYFEYHYRLPAGIYQRFTAKVAIHAVLGAMRSIDVMVKLDGKEGWKSVVHPGKPAVSIDIDAAGCRDIQLISSGPRLSDPDGKDNHVVWVEPRLHRHVQ